VWEKGHGIPALKTTLYGSMRTALAGKKPFVFNQKIQGEKRVFLERPK